MILRSMDEDSEPKTIELGDRLRLRVQFSFVYKNKAKNKARLARHKSNKTYLRASKILLNGVSAVRRKSLKPPRNTVSRRATNL
jgi:hypothetical protein